MRKRTVGAIGVALLVAGCGASNDYANDPRPPRLVQVDVAVTDSRVTISPSHLGAGPATVVVSNQSERPQEIRLVQPDGADSACLEADASSGPINPMGTAKLKVDLVEGDCVVSARRGPRPARLVVGPERRSAQADLLLP
jgi:hypothetical protein